MKVIVPYSEKIIDLGEFGKFSITTLMANRQLHWAWKEYTAEQRKKYGIKGKPKYDVPKNLEEAFSRENTELRESIDRIEEEKHRKIRYIALKLEQLAKLKKKLELIDSYRKKVIEVVNR